MEAFRALVERAGGRQRVLLVGEARAGEPPGRARALLEGFGRELFAESGPGPGPGPAGARRVRVRVGDGRGRRLLPSGPRLLLVLFAARSLLQPGGRARARLREILRDVRGRLPSSQAPAAVVGVAVLEEPPPEPGEALRPLEALLREAFPERAPERARDTLQAAQYLPGGAGGAAEVRAAACRALGAALKLQADRAEVKKVQLPAFLQCIPWGRRSQKRKGHLGKAANNLNDGNADSEMTDSLQDAEEGVALTNMALNGEL
ncbi:uncharacterized protein C2orf72 homolog [Tiliqua scincoides]|uniref:uncharacterized protein C2orf72 homolog n=1 Tax=Tiliqua scincoides TaxID=71010 RepID=UPI003461A373